jgi:hypothetical protein
MKNLVKILATLGLIVAIALILKGVFGVGEISLKKLKTNTNKQIKNSKEKISIVRFSCEGQVVTKMSEPGEDLNKTDTGSFIDEYTLSLDASGKPAILILDETNNWSSRPSISGVDYQTLESSQSSISIYHKNYKHSDKITTTLYTAMISLRSGSFSGSVDGYYKDGKYLFVSTANLTGKCFGLEKYIKSLNEK